MEVVYFRDVTIIQLEYIIAVDNHRHFGKAAEACFVTQPTLSMQIQKLEDQLGVMIFDRGKHPVAPTDIGERIILQARKVVNDSKKITEIINTEKGEITGNLIVGIIPSLSPYLLPLFVKSFTEHFPKVSFTVKELVTEEVIKQLKNETLDIGIIVTPYEDPALISKPLFYEEFKAYVSSSSTLVSKTEVGAKDINNDELWLLNEGHCFREQVLNICQANNLSSKHFNYESGSLEALKKIVDRHGGITLLPELATLDLTAAQQENLRGFKEPKPIREVSLVNHRGYHKQKIVEALHKEILSAIPDSISIKKNGEVIKWN